MNSRTRINTVLGSFVIFASFGATTDEELTVVSWGGSYAKACLEAFIEPFEKETGIKVHVEDFNGGLAQIRAQVDTGHVYWDVVDLETQDELIGCDEGLLEYVGDLEFTDGSDGTPAEEDFLENANSECGVGTIAWATAVAYDSAVFDTDPPTTIQDFFDLEKYPGKRGLRRTPEANLEFALMADGVAPTEVYEVLSTSEGVDRAFKKLDLIKDSIVFWVAGAQPAQLLADNEVAMTTAFNGRIFNALNLEAQSFVIIWDGHVRDYGQFAIVAGSPNLENAKAFLVYSARTESQAGVGNRLAYGPLRHSSWKLVDKHVETGIDMRPHMPTAPANSKNFLFNDAEWWAEYEDELVERFSAWLAQ